MAGNFYTFHKSIACINQTELTLISSVVFALLTEHPHQMKEQHTHRPAKAGKGVKVKVHTSQRPKRLELIPIFLA